MRKIAIVGSRTYPSPLAVYQFVNSLPQDVIIVSGGCPKGPDAWAESAAKARGLEVIIFKAEWVKYGKRAGFLRNELIVKEADEIVAFWDGESAGTAHTTALASKYQKPCLVYGPPIVPIIKNENWNNRSIEYGKEFALKSAS